MLLCFFEFYDKKSNMTTIESNIQPQPSIVTLESAAAVTLRPWSAPKLQKLDGGDTEKIASLNEGVVDTFTPVYSYGPS